jgi:peptidylprolyl isomerase
VFLALALLACQRNVEPEHKAADPGPQKVTLPSGVAYQDLVVGQGPAAKAGQTVTCHATGWLTDGTQFWSSHDGDGPPIPFTLRNPGVIQGWVEGVPGMKPGGKRKLWIPSALAYGKSGRGPIPPDADLTFEVELVSIDR